MAWTLLVAALACASLLAVFRAPVGALWMPRVGMTEGGHLFAAAALITGAAGWLAGQGWWIPALSTAAAVLFLVPLVRSLSVARALPGRFRDAFGAAGPNRSPLSLRGLVRSGPRRGPVTTHTYADGLTLDLYGGGAQPPRPLVVAIHGGSWNSGDSSQLASSYHRIAARGYAVAAVNYRLVPDSVFPAQHEDVGQALDFLQAHAGELGVDAGRIVLYGRSAGGQLALLAAYTRRDPAIRGVVALYAPTDLHWSWEHPTSPWVLDTPGTLSAFLGGTPATAPEAFAAASPMHHVGPDCPPTLLVHGGGDELVFAEQSRRLLARLHQESVLALLLEPPGATHGLEVWLGSPSGQLTAWAVDGLLDAVVPLVPLVPR